MLVVLGVLTAACGSGAVVQAGSGPSAHGAGGPASTDGRGSDPDVDLPGQPAQVGDGCSVQPPGTISVADFGAWSPINEVVNRHAGLGVAATVLSISHPRISSPGAPGSIYFRVATLLVGADTIDLSQPAPASGTTIRVPLYGAGKTPADRLCYGPDGGQDSRQLPLAAGDRVFALLVQPMPGTPLSGDGLYHEIGVFGWWLLDADGHARSGAPAYDLDYPALLARIRAEHERGYLPGDQMAHDDPLSSPPTTGPISVPSMVIPPPPGLDYPNSPSVPSPSSPSTDH